MKKLQKAKDLSLELVVNYNCLERVDDLLANSGLTGEPSAAIDIENVPLLTEEVDDIGFESFFETIDLLALFSTFDELVLLLGLELNLST
jgi:hypothetical protein